MSVARRTVGFGMARKFDLNKVVSDYCSAIIQTGRYVEMENVVEHVAELSGRLAENVRKSLLPLMMAKLTRVADDIFVEDSSLDFKTPLVDKQIEKVMGESTFLPLRSFEPFKNFPPFSNNWEWNVFVFESYCLKFSRRFKRVSLLFNKQCTGAIVSSKDERSFHEILVEAAAVKTDMPLIKDEVVDYFKRSGLIGKAKYEKIDELLKDASLLRSNLESQGKRDGVETERRSTGDEKGSSRSKNDGSQSLETARKRPVSGGRESGMRKKR